MRRILIPLVAAMLLVSACQRTLTDYVTPFVGTDGHGHTFPGAILPFGMVQVSPDTRLDGWDGCSGYHYSDDTVYGFSHTHLSGTGCSDYGDLLLMPFTEENGDLPDSLDYSFYLSTFSHSNEKAEPGYYRVVLDRNRVMAELTVHGRNALHKYTFPHAGRKGVVVDLKHRDVVSDSRLVLSESTGEWHLCGYRLSAAWNPQQQFYFALTADCNPEKVVFFKDGKPVDGLEPLDGEDCKALLLFPDNIKEVTLMVGISAVDDAGAWTNLKESDGITFQQAKKQAHATWEKALGQIEVEGGSREDRANFYTALYHCMTSPYLYSDADGRYLAMKDRDTNIYTIQQAEGRDQYTVFSVWDTYRALHPLLNIVEPERSRDFVLTMLDHYRHSGELTMWELASHETHCMIGYHAVSVILDAYRTGVLDSLDQNTLNELLQAMVATSNLPILGRTEYARDGFLSSEYENESVSKTLEYAYDDWCISEFARLLVDKAGKDADKDDIEYPIGICDSYKTRCQSWKNIMDADGFMHPRRNGAFVTPFDPTEVNNHFTEANSWQYSTYVPHDVRGWIEHIGGPERAEQFLDSLFRGSSKMTGRDQSDITGLIGQYAHGNEPSHHAAYLYAYLGRQWKTAELVRRICTDLYHDTPDGLCGNEDCGQMSAWYVMSVLGFYPVCPGSGQYVVGSPLFDKVTIHLHNGHDIVINAKGQGINNCYVHSLRLNGAPYDKAFLTAEQLLDGCTLDFEMSSKPDKEWASTDEARPHSIYCYPLSDNSDQEKNYKFFKSFFTKAPVFNDWQQSFDNECEVTIVSDHKVFYTTDGTEPGLWSTVYTGPFTVNGDAVVKAIALDTINNTMSKAVTHRLTRTQTDRALTYLTQPAPQYSENGPTGLIDRLHGTSNYRIGGWQGWQEDCNVVVDLLEPRTVSAVGVECLENMKSWIFFPSRIEVEVSADNASWQPFGSIDNREFPTTLERQELSTVHNFVVNGTPATARFVRIKASNYGRLPKWHISAGEQAWLFVDEIEVY